MNMKIKVKVKAYQKGEFPTKVSQLENDLGYLTDAQGSIDKDGKVYARQNSEWVNISDALDQTQIELAPAGEDYEGSGLKLSNDGLVYTIGVKKYELSLGTLPEHLEEDTVYYVSDQGSVNYFVTGGTAWSSGNNEYVTQDEYNNYINGGEADTEDFEQTLLPVNSEGVYNG